MNLILGKLSRLASSSSFSWPSVPSCHSAEVRGWPKGRCPDSLSKQKPVRILERLRHLRYLTLPYYTLLNNMNLPINLVVGLMAICTSCIIRPMCLTLQDRQVTYENRSLLPDQAKLRLMQLHLLPSKMV